MQKRIAVIGAGVYGITIALKLAKNYKVDLFESRDDILKAASGINQFRLHRGYHYPRSDETALTSIANENAFMNLYPGAIIDNVDQYYCISKEGSLTSKEHYLDFCNRVGLEIEETNLDVVNKDAISLCIKANEKLIDPYKLKELCISELKKSDINLQLNIKATSEIFNQFDNIVIATYSTINSLLDKLPEKQKDYQYELCEKIVVELPVSFSGKSCVILDGPFMCFDPYGRTNLFLLGNVVHAIHQTNIGKEPIYDDVFKPLLNNGLIKNPPITNFKQFIDSSTKFFPEIKNAKHIGSMYTFRTVLPFKEKTDERPTIVNQINEKIITVFAGKIVSCVEAATEVERLIS